MPPAGRMYARTQSRQIWMTFRRQERKRLLAILSPAATASETGGRLTKRSAETQGLLLSRDREQLGK